MFLCPLNNQDLIRTYRTGDCKRAMDLNLQHKWKTTTVSRRPRDDLPNLQAQLCSNQCLPLSRQIYQLVHSGGTAGIWPSSYKPPKSKMSFWAQHYKWFLLQFCSNQIPAHRFEHHFYYAEFRFQRCFKNSQVQKLEHVNHCSASLGGGKEDSCRCIRLLGWSFGCLHSSSPSKVTRSWNCRS